MPLTFDLPFEELINYRGRNPRPADFDRYWESALAELDATDPAPELRPAAFSAPGIECFHLYFTGVGGARVHAQFLRPSSRNGRGPALLMFHGYSGNAGDFYAKVGYAAAGFTVAAMDCRGQGGLSEDVGGVAGNTLQGHIVRGLAEALEGKPEKLLFRQVFLDTALLARIVMDMDGVDCRRVGATGASQGGALTLACAALEPRIARAAPVYPFLSDYKRVWEMDQAVDAYEELKDHFRHFDPRHEREEETFEKLGYVDIQNLAPRVKAEVLWSVGLMDTICPPSTQFAAYNKLVAPKRLRVYPDFGHEDLPGKDDDVFGFMLGL